MRMFLSILSAIPFPHLDPVAFRLGPLEVRWYGLAYVAGFLVAQFWLYYLSRRGILRITKEAVGDLLTWMIAAVVLGGRLGWWVFYHRAGDVPEPWYEPIAIWHGGMSFHGALIGAAIAFAIWCWWRRAPAGNVADACALVTPPGLFAGRFANFINAELVGRPSDVSWAVIFPGDTVPRHPSQLYEAALEGPILLAAVWISWRLLRRHDGATAAMFLMLYGLFRFLVEFTREPDLQLGYIAWNWLTMGQLLSAMVFAVGAILMLLSLRRRPLPAPDADREA